MVPVSQCFFLGFGGCRYVILGKDMSVDMVAANNVHQGSCDSMSSRLV